MIDIFVLGVAPILSFLPTVAKQLGYSTIVVGTIYCILPILSLITKPIVGAIVDQLRVKKILFLTFILITALTSFSLMFIPEIPLESTAELNCHELTYLNVCPEDKSMSKCDIERVHERISKKSEDLVTCEVSLYFSLKSGCLINVRSTVIFVVVLTYKRKFIK